MAEINSERIKSQIAVKFALVPEEIDLLSDEEDGVYWSEDVPGWWCCLAVGAREGFLYLVSAEVDADGVTLKNFKCEIVA